MNIHFKYSILLLLTFLSIRNLQAQSFAGGDGTENDPYQIETPAQLDDIRNHLEAHFVLNNDIDLTFDTSDPNGLFWNEGNGWLPIIDTVFNEIYFTGSLNGNGHKISGLFIERPEEWSVGLFQGIGEGSEITNLNFETSEVHGEGIVGILAGEVVSSNLINIKVHGSIYGYIRLGGLFGNGLSNSISNSFSNTVIEGNSLIGGLIGACDESSVIDSYSVGIIKGDNNIGGLIGEIQECSVTRTYSIANVIGISINIGGLIGNDNGFNESNINDSYWSYDVFDKADNGLGTSKTTEELLSQDTFSNWDFSEEGVWSIIEGETYPYLKTQVGPEQFNYPSVLSRPANLSGYSKRDSVWLSWEEVTYGEPLGYNLYRGDTLVNTENLITGDNYQDIGMEIYIAYDYSVKAVFDSSGTNIESAPSPPFNLYVGFLSGTGSKDNPYLIEILDDLQMIIDNLDKNYSLINDINASESYEWDEEKGFIPIGTYGPRFEGTFFGNGFIIDSLFINRPNLDNVGLFGYTNHLSEIRDVGVSNFYYKGDEGCGGLVGVNGGEIRNSFTNGQIICDFAAAGFVASNSGEISDSYSITNVDGGNNGSFIAGFVGSNHGTIKNSFASGNVSGNRNTGGFIGRNEGSVSNSFWNIEVASQNASAAGEARNTIELLQQVTFNNWDFEEDSTWMIKEGETYPFLGWQNNPESYSYPPTTLSPNSFSALSESDKVFLTWEKPSIGFPLGYRVYMNNELVNNDTLITETSFLVDSVPTFQSIMLSVSSVFNVEGDTIESFKTGELEIYIGYTSGDGSSENPYGITTIEQLQAIENHLDKHFILLNDINASGTILWNDSLGFKPIGEFHNFPFTGSLNGEGYIIDSLIINRPEEDFVGLFSYANYTSIENIGFNNVKIKGRSYVGTLIGLLEHGDLRKVYSSGEITVGERAGRVGGLIGSNNEGNIYESYSDIIIDAKEWEYNGELIRASEIGGLVGSSANGNIYNSFAMGYIIGDSYVGGIIGQFSGDEIVNSYAKVRVEGDEEFIGGLVGDLDEDDDGQFTSSYWDLDVSGQNKSEAGKALSTGQMVLKDSFEEWNFIDIWGIDEGRSYPYLRWQTQIQDDLKPNMVFPVSPLHKEIIDIPYTLRWEGYIGASHYEIEISKEVEFNEIIIDSLVLSRDSLQVLNLDENSTYFWRISAFDSTGLITFPSFREFSVNSVTSSEHDSEFPVVYSLSQNYPNPFNPSTNIQFDLPEATQVTLQVFDMLGRSVAVLIQEKMQAGYHSVGFNASGLASGIYIYRLDAGNFTFTKKMLLIK